MNIVFLVSRSSKLRLIACWWSAGLTVSLWHTAEELAELKAAVVGMRGALADLRANVEPARNSVLKVNVRDARDSLRRRVNQISPETSAIQVQTQCHMRCGLCKVMAMLDLHCKRNPWLAALCDQSK